MVIGHILPIRLIQPCKIHHILPGNMIQPADPGLCILQVLRRFPVGNRFRFIDQFSCFYGLLPHAEGLQKLPVQRPPETESLGRMADDRQLQMPHLILKPGRPQSRSHRRDHLLLPGSAEHIGKGLLPEGPDRICRGISPRQGIQTKPPAVDHRLPQGPEQNRTVEGGKHLRDIGRVRKGNILQHNQIGMQALHKFFQELRRQQHLLRHFYVLRKGPQQCCRLLKLPGGAFQMKGGHSHRDICNLKLIHPSSPLPAAAGANHSDSHPLSLAGMQISFLYRQGCLLISCSICSFRHTEAFWRWLYLHNSVTPETASST